MKSDSTRSEIQIKCKVMEKLANFGIIDFTVI